jgi:citrate synthase
MKKKAARAPRPVSTPVDATPPAPPPAPMAAKAALTVGGKTWELPILRGASGERAIDVTNLRAAAGLVTYDPGLGNTAICESAITRIDGDKGELLLRGHPIERLTDHCSFVEVAYLLLHGALPTTDQRARFSELLNRHSLIHEDMRMFFRKFPEGAHPMAVLSAMVVSLSSFYPELEALSAKEEADITATRLLSKLRTIAAFSYKKSVGEPFVYPSYKFSYCENFLNMMFSTSVSPYRAKDYEIQALNRLLILHADHEQNASTTAVRLVGSTGANLYASIAAGCNALWGPLHGGANQAVIEMLEGILAEGLSAKEVVKRAEDKNSPFRLMGFGHRVYKTTDPRAKIAKALCRETIRRKRLEEPLFHLALELEEEAAKSAYFTDRGLYPNVDFYTGLTYRALGFPTNMFTVLFALGRLPGWIAHWMELKRSGAKLMRPRQLYVGPGKISAAGRV